ncbi:MAG: hypothetical protein IT260_08270 [Saprospiraceae bacterium]|nr:hypothetical protein [Saprospiraceae bacterium]
MKNNKFSALDSGLFDSAELNKSQLRVVTGGATTWTNYNSAGTVTGSGTDTIGTNAVTTFSSGGGDPRSDAKIALPHDLNPRTN